MDEYTVKVIAGIGALTKEVNNLEQVIKRMKRRRLCASIIIGTIGYGVCQIIQEQQNSIDTLKDRVKELESKQAM